MNRKTPISVSVAAALATTLMAPTVALSQTLEEVIVTAQKRESNLQDTSLSVQVLGSEQLDNLNVSGFDDYVQFLPTVSFTTQRPGVTQVYMRGVNSGGDGNHSASMPSVGIYLDEQPITTINEVLDLHMYDIARVETLAGPQGTLFGASSQAGTIRIITNKPTNEFEASYDLSVNSVEDGDTGYTGEGMINIPMGDSTALRLVGWYDDAPGYIDNVPAEVTFFGSGITINNNHIAEKDFNDTETTGARALLRVDLNEDWAITPGITYQQMDSNGVFEHDPDDVGDLETTEFYDTFYDEEWYQASLTVEGRIGDLDLVYAGAYLDRDRDAQYDYTGFAEYYEAYVYEGCYLYDAAGDCTDSSQYVDMVENWSRESHEIRIQDQNGDLRWIAGFFYQEQEHDYDHRWTAPSVDPSWSVVPNDVVVWQTVQTRIDEDTSFFGEISYDFTEALTIMVGARYYDYENSLYGFNGWQGRCIGFYDDNGKFVEDQENGSLQAPCYDTGVLDAVTSNDDVLGKFNVSYSINEEAMVYFTWSEGYRAGGVNRTQGDGPYGEDFITNWELGWKTSWLDNRMRFNGATYFMEWDDMQFGTLTFGDGSPLTTIRNAGEAEIYGLEFDLDYAITNELTFSFSGAYVNAETSDVIYLEYDANGQPITDGSTIADGRELPYTPEWQFSSIIRYGTQWGENDVYAQGAWSYTDDVITDLDPEFSNDLSSYNIVNLAFGIARNNWHVDLFIDNATDERAELDQTDPYPNYYVPQDAFFSTNRPRTIGLRFGQKF
jgi:outer membrane receptor protein involved in Fe transport